FGLARVYEASQLSGLTLTGDVGGTPAYLAPEQVLHFREVRPAADQYAASATLYYLLTAQHILDLPANPSGRLRPGPESEAVPIQQRRPDVPEALARIIHQALQRSPDRRYPNVTALRTALDPVGAVERLAVRAGGEGAVGDPADTQPLAGPSE